MRKLTVLGALALLIAGLVASPVAAFAAPVQAGSELSATPDGQAAPVDRDIKPAPDEGAGPLAATGTSTAIGFALIAVALVGGGATLMVLRREGALGD